MKRTDEIYRGVRVITLGYSEAVRGEALLRGRELISLNGPTELTVIKALHDAVDELITVEASSGSTQFPDDKLYKIAITASENILSEKQKRMLSEHYRAKESTMTLRQLASAVDFRSWVSGKRVYEQLGRLLGQSMLFQPRDKEDGSPDWLRILFEASNISEPVDIRPLRLRAQLCAALRRVSWA